MFLKSIRLLFPLTSILLNALLLSVLMSCRSETNSQSRVETVELKEYDTLVSVEDNVLAVPAILRYSDSSLFVYDKSKGSVLEVNDSGDIIQKYGRKGRGPGELLRVNNIFLAQDNLYIVDPGRYFIHQYDRNGEVHSSLNYGELMGFGNPTTPPAPFSPSLPRATDIDNQPFTTLNGHVMISSIQFGQVDSAIYELMNWEGKHIADIGKVPDGSSFVTDYEELRSEVLNREVPAIYRTNAFPVNDQANQGEYFLVYSAFPRIAKYNAGGRLLWEKDIPAVPEIDSIRTHFYEAMERMQQSRNRINLKYYVSGISDTEGNLYLITNSSSLWIHQFNSAGELIRRYKIISDDVNVLPIFAINFTDKKTFIVTEEGEIRAYQF